MKVYTVWEIIDDYPEAGGGEYLDCIFQNEEDAIAYCEKKNKNPCLRKDTEYIWEAVSVK